MNPRKTRVQGSLKDRQRQRQETLKRAQQLLLNVDGLDDYTDMQLSAIAILLAQIVIDLGVLVDAKFSELQLAQEHEEAAG
jgi:hypothetical protein